jgi:penicillin-binding protein A
VWQRPISRQTAGTLQGLMEQVALTGTASCCIALEGGIPVAAKTGTAQLNGPGEPERSHAWIVAYAPADAPKYAVA